jgi:hypothetical protein
MTDDLDPGECGWCGTVFTDPPWCDHCHEERDHAHRTRYTSEQRENAEAGLAAAREALRNARNQRLITNQHGGSPDESERPFRDMDRPTTNRAEP